MSSHDDFDDLLRSAQGRLREQEEEEGNLDELGDLVELDVGEHFHGRWRGDGQMRTKDGLVDVYLLWSRDGAPRFIYRHARLVWEIEELRPQVGDQVLILRGPSVEFERGGDSYTSYRYAVRARACSDPLPGSPQPDHGGQPDN